MHNQFANHQKLGNWNYQSKKEWETLAKLAEESRKMKIHYFY